MTYALLREDTMLPIKKPKHCFKVSCTYAILLLPLFFFYLIYVTFFNRVTVSVITKITAEHNEIADSEQLQNNAEFDASIQGITSAAEHAFCEDILNGYKSQDEETRNIALYRRRSFASQFSQDWFLYSSMFVNMEKRGIYVDLAANLYKEISNTYFFDKCLSWSGVCIEPMEELIADLSLYRSCDVSHTCIWDEEKEMIFVSDLERNGLSGIKDYNKLQNQGKETKMKCTRLSTIFIDKNLKHIDYLSLDIEGAEKNALLSIDFNNVQIDVISVEANVDNIQEFIESKGYILKQRLYEDIIFVHENATDKLKWVDQWLQQNKQYEYTETF